MHEDPTTSREQNSVTDDLIERLLQEYRGFIYYLSQSYFFPGCEMEDILQEGRIALFKAVTQYRCDGGLSFRDFTTLCIRNHIRAFSRRTLRQKHLVLSRSLGIDDLDLCGADLMVDISNPEEITFLRQTAHAIYRCIRTHLSQMERFALVAHLQGTSLVNISEKYNVDYKQVDNALQRAKRKIVAKVEPEFSMSR